LLSGFIITVLPLPAKKFHFNTATVVLLYLLVIVLQSLAGGFVSSVVVAIFRCNVSGFLFSAAATFAAD
jgi:K+-sensing histidine kinase KdpD